MDQLDSRYKYLREQLYTLGFHQQLPIGSMSLVSALLEDLIKVTESYKQSKETVKNLSEEKTAWDLGIEPYKCDNSRLLSENNALHLEVIKIRDHYEKKIVDLNNTIRNLEVDKNYLDDHCLELASQIREMDKQRGKNVKAPHKKVFISTVRGGTPPLPGSPTGTYHTYRLCDRKLNNEKDVEHIKFQNDIQLLKDETSSLKKQLQHRDEEIARLHKQLTGGRPAAALGRDCCYRGISTLTEDMKLLQQQLIATKKELAESLKQQHEAKHRAILLAEEKSKYANDLRALDETALKVEEEANEKLMAKEKQLQHLESKLTESLRKIALLEAGGHSSSSTSQHSKTVQNLKAALKKTNDENDNLIERLVNDETQYQEQIKMLTRKNTNLEEKLKLLQANDSRKKSEKRSLSKSTLTDPQTDNSVSKEKILLQAEYLRRLNQPVYERELENVQAQLAMREMEIHSLKEQLTSQHQNANAYCHTSGSVQSVMNRMERETEALKLKIEHMSTEREELKKHLQEVTDAYHNEQLSCVEQTSDLSNKIKQLEKDNRALRDSQYTGTSIENRMSRLNEEIQNYSLQLDELNAENRKLKASYSQIRMLQEQTEKSLIDYQNRLFQTESQLAQTATERGAIDAKFDYTTKAINQLKMKEAKLRTINEELERDRSEMHNLLDTKTEKMCQLEAEIRQLRTDNAELNSKSLTLQRQISNKSNENVEKTSKIQKVTQETEVLRKQIEHLKGLNENLTTENSRLNHEITDIECACKELKKKQRLTSTESMRLEDSLREYVKKIKMLEDVITSKEMERSKMIDHFNELENDANALERTNHSLEEENLETKRYLTETEHKLHHLQEILNQRDNELAASDRQITQLNNHIAEVERELKRREEEIAVVQANAIANKEVCLKLDIEKKKLNEELNEASNIRRQLEEENEKLRKELTATAALDQQTAVQNLQELLTARNRDVGQLRATVVEKSTEIGKLRLEIKELKEKIQEEHENSKRHENLAQEYSIQVQEVRRELTEARHSLKVSELGKEQMQKDEQDRNKKHSKSESTTDNFESLSMFLDFSKSHTKLSNSRFKEDSRDLIEKEEDDSNQNLHRQTSSGSQTDPLKSLATIKLRNEFQAVVNVNVSVTDSNDRNKTLPKHTTSGNRAKLLQPHPNTNFLSHKKSKTELADSLSEVVGKDQIEKDQNHRHSNSKTMNPNAKTSESHFNPIDKYPMNNEHNDRETSNGRQTDPLETLSTNSDCSTSDISKLRNGSTTVGKSHIRRDENERNKIPSKHTTSGKRAELSEPPPYTDFLIDKKSKTELTNLLSDVVGKGQMQKNKNHRSDISSTEPTKVGSRNEPLDSTAKFNFSNKKSKSELSLSKVVNEAQMEKEENDGPQILYKETKIDIRIDILESPHDSNSISKKSKSKTELSNTPLKDVGQSHIEKEQNERKNILSYQTDGSDDSRSAPLKHLSTTNYEYTTSKHSKSNTNLSIIPSKAINEDPEENEEYIIVVTESKTELFESNLSRSNSKTMNPNAKTSESHFNPINKDPMNNEHNDSKKILRSQTLSGSETDSSESNKTNSNCSSFESNMAVHSMKALFRRSPPSDSKPTVPNSKRKFSDEDSLESTDELTAKHVHFSKNPNVKITSLSSKKEDGKYPNKKNIKISERMSSENANVQSEKSYIESIDSSQDSPDVSQTKNEFMDITLSSIETSHVVYEDKTTKSPLEEGSVLVTTSSPEYNKEFSTSNNSKDIVPDSNSAPRRILKQSNFDTSHLPPPPPIYKRNFTFHANSTTDLIQVVSHIPIESISYGVSPFK